MKIALTGRSVLIAAMAVFGACLASGQSQPLTLHEGFVDVPGAKSYYKDSGGPGAPVMFLQLPPGAPKYGKSKYQLLHSRATGLSRMSAAGSAAPWPARADCLHWPRRSTRPRRSPESRQISLESYRAPRTVHQLAENLIHTVTVRQPKGYPPRPDEMSFHLQLFE